MEALIVAGFCLALSFTIRHIKEIASLHTERQDAE